MPVLLLALGYLFARGEWITAACGAALLCFSAVIGRQQVARLKSVPLTRTWATSLGLSAGLLLVAAVAVSIEAGLARGVAVAASGATAAVIDVYYARLLSAS